MAGFANNKRKYGTGKSVNEALGDFMIHHQKELGIDIEIEFDNKPIRPLGASYVTITEDQYNTLAQAAKWSPK
ncbi:MAG: hypothetical protein IIB78_06920 [Proteobacteria bacterium]|nr:hypothetical protein [Pseudomonadota bacterium]